MFEIWTSQNTGGHVEFPIGVNFTNLVKDHLPNISAKFGWNTLSGLREKDENVKS